MVATTNLNSKIQKWWEHICTDTELMVCDVVADIDPQHRVGALEDSVYNFAILYLDKGMSRPQSKLLLL